jgi:hypothetical protein
VTIAAVETTYAGHRFRSRLEARWAVFFDAYGVKWLYEPQGYDVGGTWYLPDFWLPDLGSWVEVKGRFSDGGWKLLCDAIWTLPAEPELPGTYALTPALLVLGEIPPPEHAGRAVFPVVQWDLGPGPTPTTVFQYAAFFGSSPAYLFPCGHRYSAPSVADPQSLLQSRREGRLISNVRAAEAFARARGARFEHGAKG